MAQETPIVTNFTAGELSPLLGGRVDLSKYFNGSRIMQNMIARAQGPCEKRPAFIYKWETKDSTKKSRLLEFEFNDEQAYPVEMGDTYMRFGKDKAQLVVANTDAAIANGLFTSNITDWDNKSTGGGSIAHDATNGRLNLLPGGTAATDIGWAEQDVTTTNTAQEHVIKFQVLGLAGDKVEFQVGSTTGGAEDLAAAEFDVGYHCVAFTPSASPFYVQFRNIGSNRNKTLQIDNVSLIDDAPVEVDSTYLEADLFDVQYAQSADIMYLVAAGYKTRKLARSGHSSWSLTEFDFLDGPYLPANTDATKTLTPSAITGLGITVTAVGHAPFAATDVGRSIGIQITTIWGHLVITEYTSPTVVKADVRIDMDGVAGADADWRLGFYSDTTGHPVGVSFVEERLKFVGAGALPTRSDSSKTADFQTFTPGTAADDPLSYTIGSNKVSPIRWVANLRRTLLGTASSEFRVGADSQDTPMTPTNVQARPETNHGSAAIRPLTVSNAVLFWERHNRKLRELTFDFGVDGFTAPDLTILAEHITQTGVCDHAYQKNPGSTMWGCRVDGCLISMTYERDEKVVAWCRHPYADAGIAEAVCSIPGDGADEVWCVNKWTVNGVTKRYVELMAEPLDHDDPREDGCYVDSSLTLDNTIAQSLTLGATTGDGITATAGGSVFVAGDVGRFIKYRYSSRNAEGALIYTTAIAEIATYVSGTGVTVNIKRDFPDTVAIAASAWRLTVTTVSGLDHLEGETVHVIGDGATQPDKTVASGVISGLTPAATLHIGRRINSVLKPVRFEAGAEAGTAQGKVQRVTELVVRFYRSLGGQIGPDIDNLEDLTWRTTADPMDEPPPLYSGDKVIGPVGDYDREGEFVLVHNVGLSCTVLCIMPKIDTTES